MWKRLFLAAGVTLAAAAARAGGLGLGVYADNASAEDVWSVGPGEEYRQARQSLQIPAEYGKLVSVIGRKDDAVMWFETIDGTLRNVVVPLDKLVLIRRAPLLK
jgi:hypothetical protein